MDDDLRFVVFFKFCFTLNFLKDLANVAILLFVVTHKEEAVWNDEKEEQDGRVDKEIYLEDEKGTAFCFLILLLWIY